eukprot:CAMPEP_0118913294 /NCGR_PEP_ID=MMETSP1166-20130328/14171_1 /TAXON_ID=1104430 /ORGANISM="Chrysoreinhardia sp, Strain CCMP3193" /LENGTH=183 /DNA_ID=CAMNT_0006852849 /DNA_START=22 /DNA_END=573 /DNA_ORIENTATION=-
MVVVTLNVYDLEPSVNEVLYPVGLGLFHSGIEVGGREYTYADGHGIVDHPPRAVPYFRGSITLGEAQCGVPSALEALRGRFTPTGYDLTSNNCNTFADALSFELTRQRTPPFVNRMAAFGACVACLIPQRQPLPQHQGAIAFQGQGHTLSSPPPSSRQQQQGDDTQQDLRAKVRAATLKRFGG